MTCEKKFLIKKWLGKYMVKIKNDLKIEEGLQKKLNELATRMKQVRYDSNCLVWTTTDEIAHQTYKVQNAMINNRKNYIIALKEEHHYKEIIHDIRVHLKAKF